MQNCKPLPSNDAIPLGIVVDSLHRLWKAAFFMFAVIVFSAVGFCCDRMRRIFSSFEMEVLTSKL